MLGRRLAALLALVILWPAASSAGQGRIIAETGIGCVRFVVETGAGYSLLMWNGGAIVPSEGDTVRGALHKTGYTNVSVDGHGTMNVWIEEAETDPATAADFFYNRCLPED